MKKFMLLTMMLALAISAMGQSYATIRQSGTIMISGAGTYETDLSADLKESDWNLGVDGALFFFPWLAAGLEFGYQKHFEEFERFGETEPGERENIGKYFGPRAYIFLGSKRSQLTPFIKGGANYLVRNSLIDGEETLLNNQTELGLTASAGLLLNLAKNVGLTIESEYNFEKGTEVEDIDTEQLLIKFGIKSFLTD
ncbi:MAG: porin family protein [Candidatus Marinimicrobia bacterium]|nr:porin family protein [Candidatus Neomarinimicrobiota bacterium]